MAPRPLLIIQDIGPGLTRNIYALRIFRDRSTTARHPTFARIPCTKKNGQASLSVTHVRAVVRIARQNVLRTRQRKFGRPVRAAHDARARYCTSSPYQTTEVPFLQRQPPFQVGMESSSVAVEYQKASTFVDLMRLSGSAEGQPRVSRDASSGVFLPTIPGFGCVGFGQSAFLVPGLVHPLPAPFSAYAEVERNQHFGHATSGPRLGILGSISTARRHKRMIASFFRPSRPRTVCVTLARH